MRRLLTAGAAVALALTGLIAAPAKADSTVCNNGGPTGWTETTLVNTVVYVGIQRNTTGRYVLTLCYSDTPSGSPSNLVGGQVEVEALQVAPGRWDVSVMCDGDSPTMLGSVNCNSVVSTTTTTSTTTSPPSAGATLTGWTLVENSTFTLGTTGANTGSVGTTTTYPEVTYGGTCATVAGITVPIVTSCTSAAVDAQVARGDVGTVTGATGVCLVTAGASCLVWKPGAGIVLWGDTANSTQVDVLGIRLLSDPGTPQCYGSC